MLVSCPGCKKVFSKPLVMLDFSGVELLFTRSNIIVPDKYRSGACARNMVLIYLFIAFLQIELYSLKAEEKVALY